MGREDFNMKSHSLRPIMSIPSSVLLSLYYDSPDLLDLLKADEWNIAYGLRRYLSLGRGSFQQVSFAS